jgi:hypothetical protein
MNSLGTQERLQLFRSFSVYFRFAFCLIRFVRFRFAYDVQCSASKRSKRKNAIFRYEAKNSSHIFRIVSLKAKTNGAAYSELTAYPTENTLKNVQFKKVDYTVDVLLLQKQLTL